MITVCWPLAIAQNLLGFLLYLEDCLLSFGPCWTLVVGASINPLQLRGCNRAYSE